MRVGILDVVGLPARGATDAAYHHLITKQAACVAPQAVAVWCRRAGHRTSYATYHGFGDPRRLLPADLDVVFLACYTRASPVAYAVAASYRRAGVLTVIGGSHAKAFPADCLRYVDIVVGDADAELVEDIVAGRVDPGQTVSAAAPFTDVPSVEERMPEIRATSLAGRLPRPIAIVPVLASIGCPYRCDFCMDWDSPYRTLPTDRIAEDVRFVSERLPGTLIAFHDPNFGLKFDSVLDVLEELPPERRPPYLIESSLTVLRGDLVARLRRTNCALVAPGIESWTDYSAKAGVGRARGADKVGRVAAHLREIADAVPYLQANLMFGLDGDEGCEPVELTRDFMARTPFAWPGINIPVPFGGTPFFDELHAQDRILTAMPFLFWYAPYLVIRPRHYEPMQYYRGLLDLVEFASSPEMLRRRLRCTPQRSLRVIHRARTAGLRANAREYRRLLAMLDGDAAFRRFHDGRSTVVPEYYHRVFERVLGPLAAVFPRAERAPLLA